MTQNENPSPTPAEKPPRTISAGAALLLLFPVLGLLIGAVMLFSNAAANIPATPAPVVLPDLPEQPDLADTPVIDFELPVLNGADGQTAKLTDFNGRVVFLNFWATWCEPCERELPAFMRFQAEQNALGDEGAVVLAVNIGETADEVRAYLLQQGVTGLTVLLDESEEVASRYGVFNIPVTFVIDEDGIVRYPKYGEMTVQDLAGFMQALESSAARGEPTPEPGSGA